MTPHLLIRSFGPKIGSVDGICHQTDSMNRFHLDVRGIKGCKYKTSSWHLNGFPDADNNGSTA